MNTQQITMQEEIPQSATALIVAIHEQTDRIFKGLQELKTIRETLSGRFPEAVSGDKKKWPKPMGG